MTVFVLLVQAVFPTAAMAAQSDGALVICTAGAAAQATTSWHTDSKPKGLNGMPCQDCLAAAMAAITTPDLAVQPVAYAVAVVEHAAVPQRFAPRARAPPRPPGQGPPTA